MKAVCRFCLAGFFLLLLGWGIPAPGRAEVYHLSKAEAVLRATEQHELVGQARAAAEETVFKRKETFAIALPQLEAEFNYRRNIKRPSFYFNGNRVTSGETNVWDFTVDLEQNLYAFGKLLHAVQAARLRTEVAEIGVDTARNLVALQAKDAYDGVLFAGRQVEIAALTLELAKKFDEEVGDRLAVGMASEFDRLKSRLKVSQREAALVQSQGALDVARQRLAQTTGLPADGNFILSDPLDPATRIENPRRWVEEALGANSDLRARKASLKSEKEMEKLFRSLYLPTLVFNAEYKAQDQRSDQFLPKTEDIAHSVYAGISFKIPIWDGGTALAQMHQSQARQTVAELGIQLAGKELRLALESQFRTSRALEEEMKAHQESVEVGARAYELAKVRFENGLGTSLDVASADVDLTQARLDLAGAALAYAQTWNRLEFLKDTSISAPQLVTPSGPAPMESSPVETPIQGTPGVTPEPGSPEPAETTSQP